MPKEIKFQDGERVIHVKVKPMDQQLIRGVFDKLRRGKEGIRITDQSDAWEKSKLSDATLKAVIADVEIAENGHEKREASSIEIDELFFGKRTNPGKFVVEAAIALAGEEDREVKAVEGN